VALVPPGYTTFLAPTTTGGVRRYDLASGRPLDGHGVVGPGLVVVSADGKRAAVALPGSLAVVETATGKRLLAVEPPGGVLLVGTPGVALSADGKVLAYGGRGRGRTGTVVVWDLATGQRVAELEVPLSAGAAALGGALSPGGSRLVVLAAAPNPAGRQMLLTAGFDLKTGKKLSEVEDPAASGTLTWRRRTRPRRC
jgi:hypothetical protein